MKQKTIKTDKATLLVVELDKFTDVDCPIEIHGNRLVSSQNKGLVINSTKLTEGNWQLLGRLPDITEEQASKAVPTMPIQKGKTKRYITAKEALLYLLQSNEVYFENPLGVRYTKGWDAETDYRSFLNWQEAQSKVWDKERCYILTKVD